MMRQKLPREYLENIKIYLESTFGIMPTQYGGKESSEYDNFIREMVMGRIVMPKATIIDHPTYGSSELKEVDLLTHINNNRDKVLSPSGSIYERADVKPSILKQFVDDLLKQRSIVKKKMLEALGKGDIEKAAAFKNEQNIIKININSLIGAMGNPYNCFYNIEGFNSVTSISRHSIMLSYAHTERLLEGNFYLPSDNDIINHLVILKRKCPDHTKIYDLIKKHNLYIPDYNDLLLFFKKIKGNYSKSPLHRDIQLFLENSNKAELSFFYYFNNLPHIFRTGESGCSEIIPKENHNYFFNLFNSFFDVDRETYCIEDADKLTDLDEDLLIMITVIYDEMLGDILPKDLKTKNPIVAAKLYNIGLQLQNKLDELSDIFEIFITTPLAVPQIQETKHMIRRTVIVSDTDSVIFTTKNWIKWFTGRESVSVKAYEINCLMVYFLSKTTEGIFKVATASKGATGKDINAITMKNEFLYPVFMTSPLKKHYAGYATVQEGTKLKKVKKDIKGVNLRSSSLCKESLDFVEKFTFDLLDEISMNDKVYGSVVIRKVLDREQQIKKSLIEGNMTYLVNKPVKNASEYKNPDSSIYFNYQLWQQVFSKQYGEISIPSKCYIVPLEKEYFISKIYMDELLQINPEIAISLQSFIKNYGVRDINMIPINPMLSTIPKELIKAIDARSVIYQNCSPLYLVMRSLCLGIGNSNQKAIYSDYY